MGLFSLWDKKGKLKEQERAFKTEKINEYKIAFKEIVKNKRENSLQLFDTTKVEGKNYLLELLQYEYADNGGSGRVDFQHTAFKVFDLLSGKPVLTAECRKCKNEGEIRWAAEKEAAYWWNGAEAEVRACSELDGWELLADCGKLYTYIDGVKKSLPVEKTGQKKVEQFIARNAEARRLYIRSQNELPGREPHRSKPVLQNER